jgi:hypothetical protein
MAYSHVHQTSDRATSDCTVHHFLCLRSLLAQLVVNTAGSYIVMTTMMSPHRLLLMVLMSL